MEIFCFHCGKCILNTFKAMKNKIIVLVIITLFTKSVVFSQVSAPALETTFHDYLRAESGRNYTGSALPVFLVKEGVKGSPYLFDKWVNGIVIGVDGMVYNTANLRFNFDKINEKLLVLLDSVRVIVLNSGDISAFRLSDNETKFSFERLKNLTDLNFYQPVYKNERGYSFYKIVTTKLKPADYHTNGIIESGSKYDVYIDETQYFIVTSKQELLKITLKKKSIQKVLENESAKVASFYSQHKGNKIDENFVKSLLEYVNQ